LKISGQSKAKISPLINADDTDRLNPTPIWDDWDAMGYPGRGDSSSDRMRGPWSLSPRGNGLNHEAQARVPVPQKILYEYRWDRVGWIGVTALES